MLLPAMSRAHNSWLRSTCRLRSLRILNAIKRFQAANPGTEPTLEQLALPADATRDPYAETQMIIRYGPDGPVIYSIGDDLADSGGKLAGVGGVSWSEDNTDYGVGPLKMYERKKK